MVAAATATKPTPMVVGTPTMPFGNDIDPNEKVYVIEGGPCGFAWVNVRPATTAFAKWLKTEGIVREKAYGGGYNIWIGDYGQSMQRKETHAYAMANVLQEAGIKAYAQSRMD